MKILSLIIVMCLAGGCIVTETISKSMLGTEDAAPPKRVLEYTAARSDKGLELYAKLLEKVEGKNVWKVAKFIDEELERAEGAGGESNTVKIGNQLIRLYSEPRARADLEAGMEKAVSWIGTGINGYLTGGTGGVAAAILGGLFAGSKVKSKKRINKEVLKNIIKTKIINENPDVLAKVNEAAKYTEVEGTITT